MRRKRVLAGIVLVLFVVFGWFGCSLYRSIPPLEGSESLPALDDSVTVTFDDLGIPRIAARSDADAFRALGYLHARDRLFSMDIMRRAGEGRLAEVLGGAAVSSDRFLRNLAIAPTAEAILAILPADTRRLLDAYVEGVNRWIAEPGRALPPEFRVLGYQPEPWTAQHSLMIARLMSWDLASAGPELRLAELVARFGEARAMELAPWYPGEAATIIAGSSELVPELAAGILASTSLRASNSWVISGARSATGKPILANDPHLGLRAPSLWYLASLTTPTLRVAGATLPGLPGVVLGRNQRIAWGLTNISVDDVDYVIERLSADSSRVLVAGSWELVASRRDSIRVKGRAAVPYTFRRTSHGPLVESRAPGTQPSGEVLALAMRWNAHEPSDELTAVLGIMRAATWADFLAALRGFKSPEQNWIYADVDGNIGYTAAGNIPVRRSGLGLLPTEGWTDAGRWERYLSFEELPRVLNPAEGFIVTANNKIGNGEWGIGNRSSIVAHWELPYRAMRIREMIESDSSITPAEMQRMQMDSVDVFAREYRGLAAQAAHAAGRADLAARLQAWDGTTGSDRIEPALFYTWYRVLQRLTFDDEITYRPGGAFHRFLAEGGSPWFDDVTTRDSVETLASLAARAMREALPLAEGREWGDIHQTLSPHTLGPARPLEVALRLNVGPFRRAGSPFTPNVAGFGEFLPPFTNTHAASFRQVADLSDTTGTNVIITTGQSGNPLSRRYRNQAPMWLRGELVKLEFSGGNRVLRLTP
jgi:penicillin amidase